MTGCKILGCVLNKVPSSGNAYRYRYRYYGEYKSEDEGEKKNTKKKKQGLMRATKKDS
jgi:hypothetical protein